MQQQGDEVARVDECKDLGSTTQRMGCVSGRLRRVCKQGGVAEEECRE